MEEAPGSPNLGALQASSGGGGRTPLVTPTPTTKAKRMPPLLRKQKRLLEMRMFRQVSGRTGQQQALYKKLKFSHSYLVVASIFLNCISSVEQRKKSAFCDAVVFFSSHLVGIPILSIL